MSDATDLSFATSDELADELIKRFGNVIIVADMPHKADSGQRTLIRWEGNCNACIGLAHLFAADLTKDCISRMRRRTPE